MTQRSAIEWTDHTWNPWQGCTQVSPGCAHCYMFREKRRFGQDPETVVRSAAATFTAPLRWTEPARVFTCSWSDFFHESADDWRDEAWDIIRRTPHLTYQVLTKRIERVPEHLPADWDRGYPNVWLGVSVENNRHVYRAAELAVLPARVRFVSAEPLLGPVGDLDAAFHVRLHGKTVTPIDKLDWVIVGGESGPNARPMQLSWAREVRDLCEAHGVAFFLKQLGGVIHKRGGDEALLDGVRHQAMPEVRA